MQFLVTAHSLQAPGGIRLSFRRQRSNYANTQRLLNSFQAQQSNIEWQSHTHASTHARTDVCTQYGQHLAQAQDMAGLPEGKLQGRALGRAGHHLDTVVAPASLVGSVSDVSLQLRSQLW